MNHTVLMQIIDEQFQSMVEDICECVSIPSISNHREDVSRALHYFIDRAKQMGFEARTVLENQVGIVEWGEGSETIGILTHVDVVPPGRLENWSIDPFKPIVKEGAIWGRGTLDDKGPAIACLYAMKALKTLNLEPKKKIQMIIGTQEEVQWCDMEAYVDSFELPDYGFTPDGEFPLCNIEKGFADIKFSFAYQNTEIKEMKGGQSENSIPELAIVRLGDRFKNFDGKAAHSCIPDQGDNAVLKMIKALETELDKTDDFQKVILFVNECLLSMDCSQLGIKTQEEWVGGEYVHHNTQALTLIELREDSFNLHLNLRFTVGTEIEHLKILFDNLADKYGFIIDAFDAKPTVYIPKEKPFLKVLAEAYEKVAKRKNAFALAYGGSYAKAMPNIISWGPVFPEDEDLCHEADERIGLKQLKLITEIYSEALYQLIFNEASYK